MTPRYFTPATFAFLRGLARHNDRDWFARHRAEYEEHVRDPSLRLILDLAPNLAAISPLLVADPRPIGGSLFRIHRDTRFAADKRPYKTHVGIRFFHAATTRAARGLAGTAALGRLDAPVLYLHVEPRGCFVGGGIWHPAPPTLKRLRDFMVDNPRSWTRLTTARSFKAHFALGGEALARPPKGYPKDHPLLEDLKRKDLIAAGAISDAVVTGAGFDRLLLTRFRQLKPLCEWLALGLGLEF
jgi:uncharacterized protein (TIGR02453 family)